MRLHAATGGRPGGDAVVLLHGFGSTTASTFGATGWTTALEEDGRRWVAIDLPAHGASERAHDPAAYGSERLNAAIDAVLDEHAVSPVALAGYSLGGQLALRYASARAERVRCVVAGGVGSRRVFGPDAAAALRAHVAGGAELADPALAVAWALATRQPDADVRALLALIEGVELDGPIEYAGPTLLFRGADDAIAAGSEALAAALPGGAATFVVDGRNHMNVLSARVLKERVGRFLREAFTAQGAHR